MIINSSELREKDVINTCNGRKLGTICDYRIDTECGRVCAVYVTGQLFGIFCDKNVMMIPWDKIECIGDDTVLVRVREEDCREPCGGVGDCKRSVGADKDKRKKGGWLF